MVETAALPNDAESLKALLVDVIAERDTAIAKNEEFSIEVEQLREYVRLMRSQRFGSSSERTHRDQLGLFNEAEQILDETNESAESEDGYEARVCVPEYTRKKRGRRALPAWMERVEVLHDLPEDQKVCVHDGTILKEIGRETSEQIEFIPATARVLQHIRPKYACPTCHDGVLVAPVPPQPIPKSMASPSLLAFIAVSKYADALPLYRQAGILERIGLDVSRATLAHWMIRCGELAQPLINLMRDTLLDHGCVQCDESRYQVLKEPGKAAESHSYIWVQRGEPEGRPIVLFEYDPSRSAEVPKRLFEGYQGILQTDGYKGYDSLGRESGVIHIGCWAHARRKFTDALKGAGKKRKKGAKPKAKQSKAQAGLRFIKRLYEIERTVKDAPPDERLRVRQEESIPVLKELRQWVDVSIDTVVPQSLTGKAIAYLHSQWPKLIRAFEYGHVPLDTNLVENAIRPFAIGRKNWMFADTVRGAEASANLYSLVVTAKANGLDPWAYLERVFAQIPKAQTIDDYEVLLPFRIEERNDVLA